MFQPSALQGALLDQQINAELAGSLHKVAKAVSDQAQQMQAAGAAASPLAFAAYYDLALAARRLLATKTPSARREDTESTGTAAGPLRITTLTQEFYSPEEIQAISRWLDIEPENAMMLQAESSQVVVHASQEIRLALKALALGDPSAFAEFTAITREIILARSGAGSRIQFRGASSFALWGALAINPQSHSGWWTYLATLVHESAHSVLFGLSRSGPLVLNPSAERYFSPLRQEKRPMDGIYHAAFVSAREAWVLARCLQSSALLESGLLTENIFAELRGTQTQSLESFHDCLFVIREHGELTELGARILAECEENLSQAFA